MPQGDFWDRLKQRVREVSTAAADFTEEKTLIGKLKFELLNIKRKIDRFHREIGVRITDLAKMDPLPQPFKDESIQQLLSEIKDQEQLIQLKKKEIDKVTDHFRAKSASRQTDEENDDVSDITDENEILEPTNDSNDDGNVAEPDNDPEEKSTKKSKAKKTKKTTKTDSEEK